MKNKKVTIKERKPQTKVDYTIKEIPFYVYKFLDINNKVIYVGKTNNIDRRLKSHKVLFPDFVYEYENIYDTDGITLPSEDLKEVKTVLFSKVDNGYLASIYEAHLISIYLPKYNNDLKYFSSFHIDLPDLDWYEYILDYSMELSFYYFNNFINKNEYENLQKEKDIIKRSIVISKIKQETEDLNEKTTTILHNEISTR